MFNNPRMINVMHFLLIGPFLAYLGWTGTKGEPIPEWTWQLLLAVGIMATAYHFLRYNRQVEGMVVMEEDKRKAWNEGFTSVARPSQALDEDEY